MFNTTMRIPKTFDYVYQLNDPPRWLPACLNHDTVDEDRTDAYKVTIKGNHSLYREIYIYVHSALITAQSPGGKELRCKTAAG